MKLAAYIRRQQNLIRSRRGFAVAELATETTKAGETAQMRRTMEIKKPMEMRSAAYFAGERDRLLAELDGLRGLNKLELAANRV